MNAVIAERAPAPIVTFKHQLDQRAPQFAAALPAHIPVERFMRVVLTAVQVNPELLEVDRQSLFNAAVRAAQDGLLPDGREGAMVVRKDYQRGKLANWQPMIAGIRKKARNSGEIATWDAHLVHKGDHFQFQLGDAPQVNHTYDLSAERGPIIGAYSVCVLKDGTKSYEVMSIAEIHAIRDRSDAWKAFKAGKIKSTPWSTDEGEMCRKTVARRHSKVLPMSTDLDDIVRRDDELYDFRAAREESRQESRRPRLVDALDQIAQRKPELNPETEAEGTQITGAPVPGEGAQVPDAPSDEVDVGEAAEGGHGKHEAGAGEAERSPEVEALLMDAREAADLGPKKLKLHLGKLSVEQMSLLTEEDLASLQARAAKAEA